MLIGLALVLAGLGFLSAGPIDFGLPDWLALVVGAVLAFAGATVVFYNFSRLDE